MPPFRWQFVVDFVILAVAFYGLLVWSRSTRALRFALSAITFYLLARLAERLGLIITTWVLEVMAVLLVLLLVIAFQSDLRRAFTRLDTALFRRVSGGRVPSGGPTSEHIAVAEAAFRLASEHLGALVVISGKDAIDDLVEGGVELNADLTAALLEGIFQRGSPLHDGAVWIEDGRVVKAGGILPLSDGSDLPETFGTRHRAAVGLTERCDAHVAVVSEERGAVSLMHRRRIVNVETPEALAAELDRRLGPSGPAPSSIFRRALGTDLRLKAVALFLAALVWGITVVTPGGVIRTITVPIEFSDVPQGTIISQQSADSVDLQVRGQSWILDTLDPGRMTVSFNLKDFHAGWHTLTFEPGTLTLPSGVVVNQSSPRRFRILLEKRPPEAPPPAPPGKE